jgi:hypothetical protein
VHARRLSVLGLLLQCQGGFLDVDGEGTDNLARWGWCGIPSTGTTMRILHAGWCGIPATRERSPTMDRQFLVIAIS